MKFVKKFLILGLFTLLGVGFCNADLVDILEREQIITGNSTVQEISGDYYGFYKASSTNCYYCEDNTKNNCTKFNQRDLLVFTGKSYVYCTSTTSIFKFDLPQQTCPTCPTCPTIDSNYCTSNNLCPSCPSCPSQYTSLECQTEYSLIPVSDVTENYCTANFDLISPADCPISSGTGDTQRSALFLNNVQYAGASNIYINVSEALDYSTTYIDSGSSFVFDVDGYVADTGYLNDILTVQEYHPNSEDFTVAFVGGLTLLLPYVVIVLFVVAIWSIIKKIFKS